jgi:hypothetical protein
MTALMHHLALPYCRVHRVSLTEQEYTVSPLTRHPEKRTPSAARVLRLFSRMRPARTMVPPSLSQSTPCLPSRVTQRNAPPLRHVSCGCSAECAPRGPWSRRPRPAPPPPPPPTATAQPPANRCNEVGECVCVCVCVRAKLWWEHATRKGYMGKNCLHV